jgi:hypothetical protein
MKHLDLCLALSLSILSACGSSTTDVPGPGVTGPGATSCDTVTIAMLSIAGSDAKACSSATQCIGSKCSAAAVECAGPDWSTGTYAGLCPTFFACAKACNCDKTCVSKCNPDSLDCASCLSSKLAMGCSLTCSSSIASCGK